MTNSAVAEKSAENKAAAIPAESIKSQNDKKTAKKNDKRSLLVMTAISFLVLIVAVSMIYFYIRSNPDLVHANDQATQISDNSSFVNPDSVQKLEHDTKNITMKPADNSKVFIACGVGMMAVMAGSFIFIKVKEYKEDN